ncbi:MAG TPA: threonine/serine exporter family protein [Aggregatilineales bacterium]|nr:threonine/serine exporter family protein [Aggregatilineales bacterium]
MGIADIFLRMIFGVVATFGFAVLFNTPRKAIWIVAALGGAAIGIRTAFTILGASPEVATFFAALCIGLVGYLAAYRLWLPRLIFTVTGIIPLIPGVPAYQVLFHFSQGNVLSGLESAVRVALITAAIALGLSAARLITDFEQQIGPRQEPQHH